VSRPNEAAETRVLHAVRRYWTPSQTFVAQLVDDVDGLGWESWVVSEHTPNHRLDFPFPADERVLRPQVPPRWRRVATRFGSTPNRHERAVYWRSLVKTVHPRLIHAHFGWVAAPTALESLGPPLVVSFHGSDVREWPHRSATNRRAFRELLRNLRYAIASSQLIADDLRKLEYRGDLHVIPAGVPLERFAYREPRVHATDPRLLFVGRQVPVKGLDILLRAFPDVLAVYPTATLTVIGDGAQAPGNRMLADQLDISPKVRFLGAASQDVVVRELGAADLLVLPSRTIPTGEAEGHPVAPKEAYARGVLVVATDCGGTAEVIVPSERRNIVPEGDPLSLARALLDVLHDPASWPERARAGRRWIEEQFDTRMLAGRVTDVYESAIDARQRAVGASHRSEPIA
jgi:glycosyltransferase involved in cell wall biosynthesis